ncbi:MAG TPA: type II toxin-antitoxin system VapC family toxin [Mariniphaga anaerophila]|uniref:Type II toxin-antitoxin system VapC family toxin n=1 Tax=Mariniphaga anaerophila TaxID=1484053 RepID=A0A831LXM2_9BACT|nr:type II toxin-antitoxin system VapC family toxin [Mariniphaga anaerophila]
MGKEYLIDTNSVIDYLDNKLPPKANELIEGASSKISVITRIELLSWPGATNTQTNILLNFIGESEIYHLEESVILKTIEIRKTYRVKLPDAIIAATALINNFSLVTRNTNDFDRIEQLEVINPHSF